MDKCQRCESSDVSHSVMGQLSGMSHLCHLCYLRLTNHTECCREVMRRAQEQIDVFDLEYLYALPSAEHGT